MAKVFTIVGSALIVTDDVTGKILVDNPKRDTYYNTVPLNDEKKIELIDTNGVKPNGAVLGDQYYLTDSKDPGGVVFTESSFRAFVRANLGKN